MLAFFACFFRCASCLVEHMGTIENGLNQLWSQNMVPKYGLKIWSQNMAPKYGPKYGPKKWSPPVLRLFHRACASASTVLRKKAHAHQSIHGKSSICFQSHRRDFWNWVWLHGMRLANLLLLSCSFCFKLKFKSVIFLLSRV